MAIPRIDLRLDASFPHESSPELELLATELLQFEKRLIEHGGENITTNLTFTTRDDRKPTTQVPDTPRSLVGGIALA